MTKINPNADRDFLNNIDLLVENNFPKYLKALKFNNFKHIDKLNIEFKHPISIIAGTNRSGKSTVLMALACSHLDFQKRNPRNGKLERNTWSSLMKFTAHDKQTSDWNYSITYKTGRKTETKNGRRKKLTRKWSGIGKKESQIKNRQVIFIDLDRIIPARFYSSKILRLAKKAHIDNKIDDFTEIEKFISYILEEDFKLDKVAHHLDKDIFKYNSNNVYSSYNAASGEDVLTRIIIDAVEAKKDSLILIDEIEMGLHPKIQRRLIDILFYISRHNNKQFILTTHSPTILASVPKESRIFIEKNNNNNYRAIKNISVNAALSKMDSKAYPLIDIYCEDDVAKTIINKAITAIGKEKKLNHFSDLINIIISGNANDTYNNFKAHQRTYKTRKIKCGCVCILDGDMQKEKKGDKLQYPSERELHFLYSDKCPESFLTEFYLSQYPNEAIKYHLGSSNPHCLFDKIIENSHFISKEEVFEKCWDCFLKMKKGVKYFDELKNFVFEMAKKYSPEL